MDHTAPTSLTSTSLGLGTPRVHAVPAQQPRLADASSTMRATCRHGGTSDGDMRLIRRLAGSPDPVASTCRICRSPRLRSVDVPRPYALRHCAISDATRRHRRTNFSRVRRRVFRRIPPAPGTEPDRPERSFQALGSHRAAARFPGQARAWSTGVQTSLLDPVTTRRDAPQHLMPGLPKTGSKHRRYGANCTTRSHKAPTPSHDCNLPKGKSSMPSASSAVDFYLRFGLIDRDEAIARNQAMRHRLSELKTEPLAAMEPEHPEQRGPASGPIAYS